MTAMTSSQKYPENHWNGQKILCTYQREGQKIWYPDQMEGQKIWYPNQMEGQKSLYSNQREGQKSLYTYQREGQKSLYSNQREGQKILCTYQSGGKLFFYCTDTANNLNELQEVMNAAAMLVCKAKKSDPIHPILETLKWLPVTHHIQYKISTICFSSTSGTARLSCPISFNLILQQDNYDLHLTHEPLSPPCKHKNIW